MENQRHAQDSFRPSAPRRPQDRYQHSQPFDRPYQDQNRPPDAYQAPYSGHQQQGRGAYLHASHPYDYSLPPDTDRRLSVGYYPPPAYPNRQDRNPSAQSHYDYSAPYPPRPDQDRWPENRQASRQERQDYLRARDRHAYGRPPADHQGPYRRLNREQDRDFRPAPPYPSGKRDGYDRDQDAQNRSRAYGSSAKPQNSRNSYEARPYFSYRPERAYSPAPGGRKTPVSPENK